jgi:transposase
MAVPIKLRDDFGGADVRAHARRCKDGAQVRRLLAIATILDGGSRGDAALVGGVTRQIVRDWVLRFNADGPDGLATRKAPGPQTILSDVHRRALEEIIESGPIPAAHGVVRWRIIDLAQWLWDEFKLSISKQALGHELRTMGYRKLSARPRHHGQRPEDIAVFKKPFPPVWRKSSATFRKERL